MKKKSVLLATILAVIFPGIGHLYLKKTVRGLIYIALDIIFVFLPYATVWVLLLWFVNIIDANRAATLHNRGLQGIAG